VSHLYISGMAATVAAKLAKKSRLQSNPVALSRTESLDKWGHPCTEVAHIGMLGRKQPFAAGANLTPTFKRVINHLWNGSEQSTIGIVGAALLIIGLCWLKFLAFSVSDFVNCGLCIAVGMAIGSLGRWMYQRARSRRVSSTHQ
jgi:hypothetical protein